MCLLTVGYLVSGMSLQSFYHESVSAMSCFSSQSETDHITCHVCMGATIFSMHICVGSRVPAKPLRFELWGAREDFLPTDLRPSSLRSHGRTRHTRNTKTQDLYWFGPPLWCNTLLQCGGGGLPLGLRMNNTRGRTAS